MVSFDILEKEEEEKKRSLGKECLSGFHICILFLHFNVFLMLSLILFWARY